MSIHHLQRVESGSCAEHRALKRHVGGDVLCPGVEGQEEEMKDWKKAYVLYKNTP